MSFVRWSDHSDVYMYPTDRDSCVCCGCKDSDLETEHECISHLDEHRIKGDQVPEYAYENIRAHFKALTVEGMTK